MTDDTTFPFISKADIAKARELIEQETGLSKRTLELVDSIWPRTPGQEPATLYTVEPVAQMDEFAGMQAFAAGSIAFPEETIRRTPGAPGARQPCDRRGVCPRPAENSGRVGRNPGRRFGIGGWGVLTVMGADGSTGEGAMKTGTMSIPLRLQPFAVKGNEWIKLQDPSAHDCLRWASQGYEIKRVDGMTAMVLSSGRPVTTSDVIFPCDSDELVTIAIEGEVVQYV